MWTQGVRSGYRRAYWSFLWTIVRRYRGNPVKLGMGLGLMVAAHHFLIYAQQVAEELERAGAKARELEHIAPARELATA